MRYADVLRYIFIILLVPSIAFPQTTTYYQRITSNLQTLKESARQKFKEFRADMHDPRSKWELYDVIENSNNPKEIEHAQRILSNRDLAQLIALGLVIPPLWYLTRGGRTKPPLPTIKLTPFTVGKLIHLKPRKNNSYDVFTILNVKPDAPLKEITYAYRQLSTKVHSDKAAQLEKEKREFMESLGFKRITKEEFKEKLNKIRGLPPTPASVQPKTSPSTLSPELIQLYDNAFKDLTEAYQEAIEYKNKQQ